MEPQSRTESTEEEAATAIIKSFYDVDGYITWIHMESILSITVKNMQIGLNMFDP